MSELVLNVQGVSKRFGAADLAVYQLAFGLANLPVTIFQFALSPFEYWNKLAWAGAFLIVISMFLSWLTALSWPAISAVRGNEVPLQQELALGVSQPFVVNNVLVFEHRGESLDGVFGEPRLALLFRCKRNGYDTVKALVLPGPPPPAALLYVEFALIDTHV